MAHLKRREGARTSHRESSKSEGQISGTAEALTRPPATKSLFIQAAPCPRRHALTREGIVRTSEAFPVALTFITQQKTATRNTQQEQQR